MKPWVAPQKRPSVSSATCSPRPAPLSAAVTASISRMPGPPTGPSLRMMTTSPACDGAGEHGRHRRLLAVEHARRTLVAAALVAGELDDAALGREVAAQDREAAAGLERLVERPHDVLPRLSVARLATSPIVAAGDGDGVLVQRPRSRRRWIDQRDAAGRVEVDGVVPPAGLEVARAAACALADAVEVVDVQLDAGLVGDRQQVQHGVGRAAAGGHAGDRVLQRGPR